MHRFSECGLIFATCKRDYVFFLLKPFCSFYIRYFIFRLLAQMALVTVIFYTILISSLNFEVVA